MFCLFGWGNMHKETSSGLSLSTDESAGLFIPYTWISSNTNNKKKKIYTLLLLPISVTSQGIYQLRSI